jgi:uncharacterized protein YneR
MKYITCFSQDKATELKNNGFVFLMERDGVWYFENQKKHFNKDDFTLKNTKQIKFLPF